MQPIAETVRSTGYPSDSIKNVSVIRNREDPSADGVLHTMFPDGTGGIVRGDYDAPKPLSK